MLGHRRLGGQEIEPILERFGSKASAARGNYRQFVADGIKTGRRDDLVGGGLRRSQGELHNNECESFDERVLGSGDFVDSLKEDSRLRGKMKRDITLTKLSAIVSSALKLDVDSVKKPSKRRAPAAARGIICHLAIYVLGCTGREVGDFLHLGPTGVSLASRRGEKILKEDLGLAKIIMGGIDK